MASNEEREILKIPECISCFEVLQRLQGYKAHPFENIEFVPTDDVSKCMAPRCPSNAERNEKIWTCRGCDEYSDPTICDCENEYVSALHEEVLSCVRRIQIASEEFLDIHFVTQGLVMEAVDNTPKSILDAPGPIHEILGSMVFFVEYYGTKKEAEKTRGPSGYPVSMPDDPGKGHCHFAWIQSWGPKDCECLEEDCFCPPCVMVHVKHNAEDLEEIVRDARENIEKLKVLRSEIAASSTNIGDARVKDEDS